MSDPAPSPVIPILRAEGVALLALAVLGHIAAGGGWLLFALAFLLPDLSMLGYLAGPRVGARVYNAAHSTIGPVLLGIAGWLSGGGIALHLALIWAAHVGFDRALGYGLKLPDGFGHTHLGRIGRGKRVA